MLGKDDLVGFLNEEDKATVEMLEIIIDGALRKNYDGTGPVIVNIKGPYSKENPSKKIQNAITEMYAKGKWSVEFHSDQKDGPYISLE